MTNVTYETAVTALMRVSHSPKPLVDITYMAGEHSTVELGGRVKTIAISQDYEPLGIHLIVRSLITTPTSNSSLDASLMNRQGIFIHALDAGSAAARDGRLRTGDQILEVDGKACVEASFDGLRI